MTDGIFRRHELTEFNGRAVAFGHDPKAVTGYHSLWPGIQLSTTHGFLFADADVAPLDAPELIPAGACRGYDSPTSWRHASQQLVNRGIA